MPDGSVSMFQYKGVIIPFLTAVLYIKVTKNRMYCKTIFNHEYEF